LPALPCAGVLPLARVSFVDVMPRVAAGTAARPKGIDPSDTAAAESVSAETLEAAQAKVESGSPAAPAVSAFPAASAAVPAAASAAGFPSIAALPSRAALDAVVTIVAVVPVAPVKPAGAPVAPTPRGAVDGFSAEAALCAPLRPTPIASGSPLSTGRWSAPTPPAAGAGAAAIGGGGLPVGGKFPPAAPSSGCFATPERRPGLVPAAFRAPAKTDGEPAAASALPAPVAIPADEEGPPVGTAVWMTGIAFMKGEIASAMPAPQPCQA
jgi:hypothetical protein